MAQNLNFEQLESLALQAGFEPDVSPTIAAISLAESGGNPNAHNPKYPDNSYGLMQINMLDEPGYELMQKGRKNSLWSCKQRALKTLLLT